MKLRIYSKKVKDVAQLDSLSKYVGKKVFSKSGDFVGKIKDVVFDKGQLKGYLVKGRLKFFLDKEFFTEDFDDAMMLKIDPVALLIGKVVFDSDGKRLGRVHDIERTTTGNDYASLFVRKNLIGKPKVIPKKAVDVSKKNIILNMVIEK